MNKNPAAYDSRTAPSASAAEEPSASADDASHFAWLLPWVLASIGFLTTLALLR